MFDKKVRIEIDRCRNFYESDASHPEYLLGFYRNVIERQSEDFHISYIMSIADAIYEKELRLRADLVGLDFERVYELWFVAYEFVEGAKRRCTTEYNGNAADTDFIAGIVHDFNCEHEYQWAVVDFFIDVAIEDEELSLGDCDPYKVSFGDLRRAFLERDTLK